jgi:hypothetical protein
MRTKCVMLAALAGLGLAIAGEAMADAENLSCISDDSPVERRVIRDCDASRFPHFAEPAPDDGAPPLPPVVLKIHHDSKDRNGVVGAAHGSGPGGGHGGTPGGPAH